MSFNKSRATVALNMRIDPDLKEQLHAMAVGQQRSLGSLIEEALRARVEAGRGPATEVAKVAAVLSRTD
jgi:predicted transcriptional regulator